MSNDLHYLEGVMDDSMLVVGVQVDPELEGPPVDWALDLLRDRSGGDVQRVAVGESPAGASSVVLRQDDQGTQGYSYVRTGDGLEIKATDVVGASYALVGLADEVEIAGDLSGALEGLDGVASSTTMPVRGIMRSFSSVDEDLPWFTSKEFWAEYLDWIAQARFSRFHLALGMQYNYGADRNGATDNYLCFAYPFLLDVPGWNVAAEGVSVEERETNLRMLQFIARETKRRGMDFQLGLWNHAYDYGRNSVHRFPITGLTPETHADYSAAAISELLRVCPEIDGFSFRVHYEGGIPDEGHEKFWDPVFEALSQSGKELQVDMHAKGVDDALLDAVNKPGLQPVLGAKYWAEHQGLPYHQAAIRRLEESKPVPPGKELTSVTEFARRFTRYGYADFLGSDRRADLIFRVWPGTQKLLLWGDPEHAAGYGRLSTFAGALGVDICEPLFFKGRKGSGAPGRRDPYIDPELKLGLRDWTKYAYTYRVWGRKLYNPEAPRREWEGYLNQAYGTYAETVERTLAPLSRILPLITVVHGVGGSNNGNWPEVYTNLPVTEGAYPSHHGSDTEAPPMWGTVSPFDPQTFYIINEWADDVIAGRLDGRYTPVEVADWLQRFVDEAAAGAAELSAATDASPQLRRTAIDVEVLLRLGRFFAAKFRSAADYALWQRTGDRSRLSRAYDQSKIARDVWAEIGDLVEGVYQANLRFGPERSEHGSWTDRRPALEADVDAMGNELRAAAEDSTKTFTSSVPSRPSQTGVVHTAPDAFDRGKPVALDVSVTAPVKKIVLNFRHVNQAEHWQSVEMQRSGDGYRAEIPADYSDSSYPLMYSFTVEHEGGAVALDPAFDDALANQPYYVVMPAAG
ncbi:hypothetical protein [Microlunatus soli]|uniref:Glycosyl hydrolase family 20, domain 2 n=1 Tax=Microlunatus soli TaxID=630515 RepID=A0A1H1TXU8_9ACTN|nr:hypothetical protein [Microlunatus soli]SDS65033.1 hypothetical protein SAMN04489812_2562 [Microlunatus soli]